MTGNSLLEVENLCISFGTGPNRAEVVRAVNFHLDRGESLALVGESGCGKSLTALALLGLLPSGATLSGRVLWRGVDLLSLDYSKLNRYRGRQIAMVFQEPATSLNPVYTAGEQVAEVLRHHRGLSRRAAAAAAVSLLEEVQLPDASQKASSYPHQLSGGMRQRVMLAAALAGEPSLLVADEPTTALDVTVQSQILALLDRLRRQREMALVFITHDLSLVSPLTSRMAVMYAGSLVEEGPTPAVLDSPAHPYTQALMNALPMSWPDHGVLPDIPGQPPSNCPPAPGCPFAPRCDRAHARCRLEHPPQVHTAQGHWAACLPDVVASSMGDFHHE